MTLNEAKLTDKILKCCDCGDEFTFTAGEQEWYIRKQLALPKRCKSCRLIKKLSYLDKDGNHE